MTPLHAELLSRIRERGPITVAEFLELALYHPQHGYYATAAQRSGRSGDFFTSVDVGPLFGELIAVQLVEMWQLLRSAGATRFDLVEAGAGNGRLARDVLDAAAAYHPDFYDRLRVILVEPSVVARGAHAATLGPHIVRLADSTDRLPANITGTIIANELLDALPVHVVIMTPSGLREICVSERGGALVELEGEPSPEVARYVERAGISLEPGARAELGLAAVQWVERAAAALERGFLLLFDYGHPAAELYSATHREGTLTAYRSHTAGARHWLHDPGLCDLTAHVNLTAIAAAAERAGLETLGMIDQTYFLIALGLADRLSAAREERSGAEGPRERRAWRGAGAPAIQPKERSGAEGPRERRAWRGAAASAQGYGGPPKLEERRRGIRAIQANDPASLERRLAARTLIMPGGLGSTIKVMAFSNRMGRPALRGLSSGRLT